MFTDEQRSGRLGGGALWVRAILVVALALAFSLTLRVVPAPALSPELLPDLVADPPTHPQAPAVMQLADGQSHLLLKFNGALHNVGAGALEIRGSNPVNGMMTVTGQRIYRQDGSWYDDTSRHPHIHFENSDGHDHWHLTSAARFSLWNQAGTAQVAPAAKVGFCLEDGEKADGFGPASPAYSAAQTQRCKEGLPNATSVFQGISSGWRDVYGANIYFQWIDISDVAPGLYRLGAQMDPDDFMKESNEANNGPTIATSTVSVPGHAASPFSAAVVGKTAVTLASQQFGTPGARRFKIVAAPSHGTLNIATGASFPGPRVTYSPSAGYTGPDSFRFLAYDSASQYPLHSQTATASLTVSRPVTLLTRLRFSRAGMFLLVRARAKLSGVLRMALKKGGRALGSCRKRVRRRHRFSCRIKLRKRTSPARAQLGTSLRAHGKLKTGKTYRVPRRIPRAR
jgi:Lysyl oxidase/Bacterial Ig domain